MATTQTAKKKISLPLVRTILPTAQPERHFSALQGPQESRCLQGTRTRTGSDVTRPLAPHLDGQVPGASSHRGSLSWGSCVVAGPDPPRAAPITTASPSNSPGEKQESPEPKHVYRFLAAPKPPGKTAASWLAALSLARSVILPRAILADSVRTFLGKSRERPPAGSVCGQTGERGRKEPPRDKRTCSPGSQAVRVAPQKRRHSDSDHSRSVLETSPGALSDGRFRTTTPSHPDSCVRQGHQGAFGAGNGR